MIKPKSEFISGQASSANFKPSVSLTKNNIVFSVAKPEPEQTEFDRVPWSDLIHEAKKHLNNLDEWLQKWSQEHNLDEAKKVQLETYAKA